MRSIRAKHHSKALPYAVLLCSAAMFGGCNGSDRVADEPAGGDQKPGAVVADDATEMVVDGQIFAEVNGERRIWNVTHFEQDGQWRSGSFWRPAMKSNATVSIRGQAKRDSGPGANGDIQLSFVIADVGGMSKVSGEVFNLLADGASRPMSSDDGGSANLFLNRVVREGEILDLGGGFSGELTAAGEGDAASARRSFKIKDASFVARLRKFQKPQ